MAKLHYVIDMVGITEWILGQYSKDEAKAKRFYKAFVDEGIAVEIYFSLTKEFFSE